MIKIESIEINEFRGIRRLTLDFKGENFAVCGPNGTGKSGVVDAIEFGLTGNVSRLSGEGRGEVSLKEHGPHVDKREAPAAAKVKLNLFVPSIGKRATIERTLSSPSKPTVSPKDPEISAILKRVERHPEIVLSRRELIRYVVATPGNRAKEVQALLHLESLEQVRAGLQKIANQCDKQLSMQEGLVRDASQNLGRAAEIPSLTENDILTAVNSRRSVLRLSPLASLSGATRLKEGLGTPGAILPTRISKIQALADIKECRSVLAEVESPGHRANVEGGVLDLIELSKDSLVVSGMQLDAFYSSGLELMQEDACPFCDNPWNLEELKTHILEKRKHLAAVANRRAAVERKLAAVNERLHRIGQMLRSVSSYGPLIDPPMIAKEMNRYQVELDNACKRIAALLPIDETIGVLRGLMLVPVAVTDEVNKIYSAVKSLPEPTVEDAARDWLTVVEERITAWRAAQSRYETVKKSADQARKIADTFSSTSDQELSNVYKAVEKDFAALYAEANREDESGFVAQIVPSMGKLGFDVDFYGRGYFPPGAYHSEGHQDSMGVCLYLALMRYIDGERFTFSVLDDVLMSVDAEHRREVCRLIKKQFPNSQFVMTTHDPIWLRHMKTEGLIGPRASVQFRRWSVDEGPTQWDDRDVWKEINDYLDLSDVRAAAGLLRNYLEYESGEICLRLRAEVEFHGDAQYDLGDLLPPAISRMKHWLAKGKDAANSWNQTDKLRSLAEQQASFNALVERSRAEQWQINSSVHYNAWATMGKSDFQPVVGALRCLLDSFGCKECGTYFHIVPRKETAESLRCECGKTNINLVKK